MPKGAQKILSNHKSARALPVPDFSIHSAPSTRIPGGGLSASAPTRVLAKQPGEQKEPTTADPIRLHHRMAGME